MKLNKILTVLAPIAVVGTILPTVSCNTDTMTINYCDPINCKDKDYKEVAYHSLETVQKAIKEKVNVETRNPINVDNINGLIASNDTETIQNIYYDLIASFTILSQQEFILASYVPQFANSQLNITIKVDNEDPIEYKNVVYDVKESNNRICIHLDNGDGYDTMIESYTYKDCTPEE